MASCPRSRARASQVNGVRVRHMAHLAEMLAPLLDSSVVPPPSPFVALQFFTRPESALFATSALREATPIIQQQHKLPGWTSKLQQAPREAVFAGGVRVEGRVRPATSPCHPEGQEPKQRVKTLHV